jgi:WWE domain
LIYHQIVLFLLLRIILKSFLFRLFLIGWHLYDDDLQLLLEKNFKKKNNHFEITINSTVYVVNLYTMTQEQKNNYLKLRRMKRATEAQIASYMSVGAAVAQLNNSPTNTSTASAAVAQLNNSPTNTSTASAQNQVIPKPSPLVSGSSSDVVQKSNENTDSSHDEEQLEPPTKPTPVTGAAAQQVPAAFVAKYLNKSIYTIEVTVKHALVLMVLVIAMFFRY